MHGPAPDEISRFDARHRPASRCRICRLTVELGQPQLQPRAPSHHRPTARHGNNTNVSASADALDTASTATHDDTSDVPPCLPQTTGHRRRRLAYPHLHLDTSPERLNAEPGPQSTPEHLPCRTPPEKHHPMNLPFFPYLLLPLSCPPPRPHHLKSRVPKKTNLFLPPSHTGLPQAPPRPPRRLPRPRRRKGPPAQGRLHQGRHHPPQEAQLGRAQDGPCPPHLGQDHHCLYPRRRPQYPAAQRRPRPRRARPGLSRCAVQARAGRAGSRRRHEQDQREEQVRYEEAQEGLGVIEERR